jgi:hypothetical protein
MITEYLIEQERKHQIAKGYSVKHDTEHSIRDLVRAGNAYIANDASYWPWETPFQFDNKLDQHVKAAAMYKAALDAWTPETGVLRREDLEKICEISRDLLGIVVDRLVTRGY